MNLAEIIQTACAVTPRALFIPTSPKRTSRGTPYVYIETPVLGFRPFSGFWEKTNMIGLHLFFSGIFFLFFFTILENVIILYFFVQRNINLTTAPAKMQGRWGPIWTSRTVPHLPERHDGLYLSHMLSYDSDIACWVRARS